MGEGFWARQSGDSTVLNFEPSDNIGFNDWLRAQPTDTKDDLLIRLASEGGSAAAIELRNRYQRETNPGAGADPAAERRTRRQLRSRQQDIEIPM